MAHNNGRIYIDTSTTPNKGVEIADLQAVLVTSDNDLGLLCADKTWDREHTPVTLIDAGRVNKWAWHKPIRQHSYGYDTRNLTAGDDGFNGDQPVGEFCIGSLELPYSQTLGSITQSSHTDTESGVTVTKWLANSGFFHDMMRGLYNWNYRRPRGVDGTYTEPFRIFDFVGYNHRCVSPMPTPPSGSRYVSDAGQITLLVDVPTDPVTGNMSLSTMRLPGGLVQTTPTLSNMYVGILLYRPNYEDCVWKTATARIGTSSAQNTNKKVSFSSFKSIGVEGTAWNKMGTWYARTFLSTHQIAEGQNPTDIANFVVVMASDEVMELDFNNGTITNDITLEVQRAKWIDVAEGVPSQIRVTANVRNGYVHDASMSGIQMSVSSGDERTDPDYYYAQHLFDDQEFATIPMLDEQSYSWVFNNVPYVVGRFTVASFSCRAVVVVDGTPITKNLSFFVDLTPTSAEPEPELT